MVWGCPDFRPIRGRGHRRIFSLSTEGYSELVNIAAREVGGQVPVFSSVGRSIPEAIQLARYAASAGVDGLLLMPSYLVHGPSCRVLPLVF